MADPNRQSPLSRDELSGCPHERTRAHPNPHTPDTRGMVAYPVGDYRLLPLNHCVPQRLHLSTRERCVPLPLAPYLPTRELLLAPVNVVAHPKNAYLSARRCQPSIPRGEKKLYSQGVFLFFLKGLLFSGTLSAP